MTFTELLDDLRIPYATEGSKIREGWIGLDCPFCGHGKGSHYLGYNLDRGYCTCWACGWHNPAEVLSAITGFSVGESRNRLKGLDRPYSEERIKRTGSLVMPMNVKPMVSAHKAYLRNRGFKPSALERLWHLKGIGISARLGWRIFIPIEFYGNIVSWTTRLIRDREPRYISAGLDEEFIPHKHLIYGEDLARHAIAIVEGPADAWRIGPGACATMGTETTAEQIRRIVRFHTRYVIFDPDYAGQMRAVKLANELSAFPGDTYNITLDSGDPGSASIKDIRRIQKLLGNG